MNSSAFMSASAREAGSSAVPPRYHQSQPTKAKETATQTSDQIVAARMETARWPPRLRTRKSTASAATTNRENRDQSRGVPTESIGGPHDRRGRAPDDECLEVPWRSCRVTGVRPGFAAPGGDRLPARPHRSDDAAAPAIRRRRLLPWKGAAIGTGGRRRVKRWQALGQENGACRLQCDRRRPMRRNSMLAAPSRKHPPGRIQHSRSFYTMSLPSPCPRVLAFALSVFLAPAHGKPANGTPFVVERVMPRVVEAASGETTFTLSGEDLVDGLMVEAGGQSAVLDADDGGSGTFVLAPDTGVWDVVVSHASGGRSAKLRRALTARGTLTEGGAA